MDVNFKLIYMLHYLKQSLQIRHTVCSPRKYTNPKAAVEILEFSAVLLDPSWNISLEKTYFKEDPVEEFFATQVAFSDHALEAVKSTYQPVEVFPHMEKLRLLNKNRPLCH